ncbi:hypothetical protein [Rossellomorea sp. YZS02]|uniref:hypothetical protein n=1 Tax=Rossellomorea sp. YZS02 TaxID=3097358 RepID=UPI002A10FCAC|nr:hypothetical protein [Rossellomorea sp. YZS02]MDX8344127.1 hypothetical protein [Rossellomorea sp. YZS02]
MIIFTISMVIILVMIGTHTARREYRKLPEAEKEILKEEIKHPIPILMSGMIYIGYLTMFISLIFDIYILRFIAFLLMGLGFIVNGAEEWRVNGKKAFLFIILGGSIVLITGLFATKSLW